jgi:type II secretory pathway component PulJ
MFCAGLATVNAASKKAQLTPEQQKEKQALIEKYDTNINGKLEKKEEAKMTQEEKDKWATLQGKAPKAPKTKPVEKPATTPAEKPATTPAK